MGFFEVLLDWRFLESDLFGIGVENVCSEFFFFVGDMGEGMEENFVLDGDGFF